MPLTPRNWIWIALLGALITSLPTLRAAAVAVPATLTITTPQPPMINSGKRFVGTQKTGEFWVSRSSWGELYVEYDGKNDRDWTLTFTGPLSGPLHEGTYLANPRRTADRAHAAAMSLDGDGFSRTDDEGSFTIKKLIYGPDQSILSLWLTFEIQCDELGGMVRGELRYNIASKDLPVNQPPVADAGTDQRLAWTAPAHLHGLAEDEKDAPGAGLMTTWSQVSGPGTASFADAHALATTANFSAPGEYVLRLTADDGALTDTDDVTIHVVDPATAMTIHLESLEPDQVGAGKSYDFSELHGEMTVFWPTPIVEVEYYDGAEFLRVAFAAPNETRLTEGTYTGAIPVNYYGMSAPGVQVRWNRDQPDLVGSFEIKTITYTDEGFVSSLWATFELQTRAGTPALRGEVRFKAGFRGSATNRAPGASAGPPAEIRFPAPLTLEGAATDDGVPGVLKTTWSMVSGPGAVTFANAQAPQTTATFQVPGYYLLRLTADDGEFVATSDLPVTVVDPAWKNSLEVAVQDDDLREPRWEEGYDESSAEITLTEADGVLTFRASTGPTGYEITLAAPQGEALEVGRYREGVSDPADYPDHPRLTVSNLGGLFGGNGDFEILSVGRGLDGKVVSISATFLARYAGKIGYISGRLNYRAGITGGPSKAPGVSAGFEAYGQKNQPIGLHGAAMDEQLPEAAVACTWSKVSGRGEVTFANAAARETTAQFSEEGEYVLKLTASDGALSRESLLRVSIIGPGGGTRVRIVSEPTSWVGDGKTYGYDPLNSTISARMSIGGGVSVSVRGIGNNDFFDLNFTAPDGARLAPGEYTNAREYPFQETNEAGMSVFGNGAGLNGLTGRFVVKEIAYRPNYEIERCWILFEQHGHGEAVATYGEVRYHASDVDEDPAPPKADIGPNRVITIGQPLTLTAAVTQNGAPAADFFPVWVSNGGPGEVRFTPQRDLSTNVQFTLPGKYIIRFAASRYVDSARDSLTVLVKSDTGAGQVRGYYRAVLRTGAGDPFGTVDVQIGASGYYTAKLMTDGSSPQVFRGSVSEDGWGIPPSPAFAIIRNADGSLAVLVDPVFGIAPTPLVHIGDGGPNAFPKATVGNYAFTATTAGNAAGGLGSAWGGVAVRPTGRAMVLIRLPDRTKVITSGAVGPDGSLLVAYNSGATTSVLAGSLRLNPTGGSAVAGSLEWHRDRPAAGLFGSYRFTATFGIEGSRVRQLDAAQEPLTLTRGSAPAVLEIYGFGANAIEVPLLLTARGSRPNGAGGTTANLAFSMYSEIRGTFSAPGTGVKIQYEGVILQQQRVGRGFYFAEGKSGAVELRVGQ